MTALTKLVAMIKTIIESGKGRFAASVTYISEIAVAKDINRQLGRRL